MQAFCELAYCLFSLRYTELANEDPTKTAIKPIAELNKYCGGTPSAVPERDGLITEPVGEQAGRI
jgi:hypothetical protein